MGDLNCMHIQEGDCMHILPWTKKRTMLLMHKSESCDFEESWSLISYGTASERDLRLPRLHASTHRSEIRPQILQYHMMHHEDGSFFGQGSTIG